MTTGFRKLTSESDIHDYFSSGSYGKGGSKHGMRSEDFPDRINNWTPENGGIIQVTLKGSQDIRLAARDIAVRLLEADVEVFVISEKPEGQVELTPTQGKKGVIMAVTGISGRSGDDRETRSFLNSAMLDGGNPEGMDIPVIWVRGEWLPMDSDGILKRNGSYGLTSRKGSLPWNIGRMTAISILLIGISLILQLLLPFVLTLATFALSITLSFYTSPLAYVLYSFPLAFLVSSAITIISGYREEYIRHRVALFSTLSLVVYALVNLQGFLSFSTVNSTGTQFFGGLNPAQFILMHLLGPGFAEDVIAAILVALGNALIVVTVYLLGSLSAFRILGKVYLTLSLIPVFFGLALTSYTSFVIYDRLSYHALNTLQELYLIQALFLTLPVACFIIYARFAVDRRRKIMESIINR